MVDRKIIEKVISNLLQGKGVTVVKCKPSYRASILGKFQEYAKEYGWELTSYKDKDQYNKEAMVTLYDPQHDTMIEFNKDFINANLIDFTNNGKKNIDIEDIFNAYNELPVKCKDSANLIKHTTEEEFGLLGDPSFAWSQIYSDEDKMLNTITIPLSYIDNMSEINLDYSFILGHESMHTRDYYKLTQEETDIFYKAKNEGVLSLTEDEQKVYREVKNVLGNDFTKMSISVMGEDDEGYFTADRENAIYLNGGVTPQIGEWGKITDNKASDYGTSDGSENYADFGAMVITGLHNPSNPSSRVLFDGDWIQFKDWAKLHPYQIQYFAKDLYNEEYTIDEILEMVE